MDIFYSHWLTRTIVNLLIFHPTRNSPFQGSNSSLEAELIEAQDFCLLGIFQVGSGQVGWVLVSWEMGFHICCAMWILST